MDDGLGFSIGALFGGILYQKIGGEKSFKVFSLIALITCIAHIILRPASTHEIRILKTDNQTVIVNKKAHEGKKENLTEEKKLTEDFKESA